jgi:hypothetical protein
VACSASSALVPRIKRAILGLLSAAAMLGKQQAAKLQPTASSQISQFKNSRIQD